MAPRCFIIRHGETEWSLSGRHTGITDLPLTENGEKRMKATGKALVGDDRLVVPRKLAHMYVHLPFFCCSVQFQAIFQRETESESGWCRYVSPRTRAKQTLDLLRLGCKERLPWTEERRSLEEEPLRTEARVEVTEAVREWDYGEYEGMLTKDINAAREKKGEEKWDIWKQGCPGGEYVLSYPILLLAVLIVSFFD